MRVTIPHALFFLNLRQYDKQRKNSISVLLFLFQFIPINKLIFMHYREMRKICKFTKNKIFYLLYPGGKYYQHFSILSLHY